MGEEKAPKKDEVGDTHLHIEGASVRSFMCLSSSAAGRNAPLLPFHRCGHQLSRGSPHTRVLPLTMAGLGCEPGSSGLPPEFPDSVRSGSCTLGPCSAEGVGALPPDHLRSQMGSLPELAPQEMRVFSGWPETSSGAGRAVPPQRKS